MEKQSEDGVPIAWRRPVIRAVDVIKEMLSPKLDQPNEGASKAGYWISEPDELTEIAKLRTLVSQSRRSMLMKEQIVKRKQVRWKEFRMRVRKTKVEATIVKSFAAKTDRQTASASGSTSETHQVNPTLDNKRKRFSSSRKSWNNAERQPDGTEQSHHQQQRQSQSSSSTSGIADAPKDSSPFAPILQDLCE